MGAVSAGVVNVKWKEEGWCFGCEDKKAEVKMEKEKV